VGQTIEAIEEEREQRTIFVHIKRLFYSVVFLHSYSQLDGFIMTFVCNLCPFRFLVIFITLLDCCRVLSQKEKRDIWDTSLTLNTATSEWKKETASLPLALAGFAC
jgi:hypothetical protein